MERFPISALFSWSIIFFISEFAKLRKGIPSEEIQYNFHSEVRHARVQFCRARYMCLIPFTTFWFKSCFCQYYGSLSSHKTADDAKKLKKCFTNSWNETLERDKSRLFSVEGCLYNLMEKNKIWALSFSASWSFCEWKKERLLSFSNLCKLYLNDWI